ncbi:fungal-specific transcription factor domain-containing protein [Phyllosticta citrichinensis]|uniref:Fungal-specific transcription factor domain-containing protein n=1 Tax=Phyllosticta citrichinensis TaxID=1130410 RepID=A0ABR1XTN0_9PEZI
MSDTSSIDQILRAHSNSSGDRVSKPSSNSPPSHTHNGSIGGASGSSGLNPRSCVTCRRRKVKCDKKHPCTNCTKARIDCIFPAPGRAPRKPRKPADAELLDRLKKLEGVVKTLGGVPSISETEGPTQEAEKAESQQAQDQEPEPEPREEENVSQEFCSRGAVPGRYLPPENSALAGLETRFGRLVVDEGKSRYINSSFWANLDNEVEDIKALLSHSSEDEEDFPSPDSSPSNDNQSYIFGYRSTNVDLAPMHPPPDIFELMWSYYKENVDPLLKIFHIPTTEPKLLAANRNRDRIPKGMESLLFAVYYATVTATASEDVLEKFGEEKSTLLTRYRFGIEQALARANFLLSDEMVVLQAFVIFLICLRRNEDARIIWTLTGLAVRMAQTLGIHRDGTHFHLSPFDVEMRRRLWWQICVLDSRASEDHGCDPTIVEASFDTKIPLNVHDSDLYPGIEEFPEERQGCTEITFCLIRFEVANVYRRIQYVPPGPDRCNLFLAHVSLEQKEQWITKVHTKVEEKYLKYCDMTVPLYWVVATVSRLIVSKMWLMIYHPYQRLDGGASLPQETRDKLFVTSLENVEYALLLETEARTEKWGWLFRTYVQWHAIAFLLSELCVRTKGEVVDRAWRAVEATAARRWQDLTLDQKKGCIWRPLRKLVSRARAAREAELQREREEILRAQLNSYPSLASQGPLGLDLFAQYARSRNNGVPMANANTSALQNGTPTLDQIDRGRRVSDLVRQNSLRQQQEEQQQQEQGGLDMLSTMPQTSPNLHLQTQGTDVNMDQADWLTKDPVSNPAPFDPLVNFISDNTSPAIPPSHKPSLARTDSSNQNKTLSSATSPSLGDDPMNWASWDDLVNQYGMDIDPGQMSQTFNPSNTPGVFHSWY